MINKITSRNSFRFGIKTMFALVLLFGIAVPFMIRLHIANLEDPYAYSPPPLCEVTGIVTLNGRPFSGVMVIAEDKSAVKGRSEPTDASGAYIFVVEPGLYKVTLSERYENPELSPWERGPTYLTRFGGRMENDAEERKEKEKRGRQLVPEEYLSVEETPLTFDIKADGQNQFDIHLYDKGDDSSPTDK